MALSSLSPDTASGVCPAACGRWGAGAAFLGQGRGSRAGREGGLEPPREGGEVWSGVGRGHGWFPCPSQSPRRTIPAALGTGTRAAVGHPSWFPQSWVWTSHKQLAAEGLQPGAPRPAPAAALARDGQDVDFCKSQASRAQGVASCPALPAPSQTRACLTALKHRTRCPQPWPCPRSGRQRGPSQHPAAVGQGGGGSRSRDPRQRTASLPRM